MSPHSTVESERHWTAPVRRVGTLDVAAPGSPAVVRSPIGKNRFDEAESEA